jgi:uncharacterized protein (DUF3084 family)
MVDSFILKARNGRGELRDKNAALANAATALQKAEEELSQARQERDAAERALQTERELHERLATEMQSDIAAARRERDAAREPTSTTGRETLMTTARYF